MSRRSGRSAPPAARDLPARPGLPAPDSANPPGWPELLDRLDRLERGRIDTNIAKGDGR